MDDFEGKLNSIFSNPEMMGQILSMAQQLGQSPPPPPQDAPSSQPVPDAALIGKLASAAGKMGVDQNQQALLRALDPYISQERIGKLEKAMRAAKLASFASSILGSNVLSSSGR